MASTISETFEKIKNNDELSKFGKFIGYLVVFTFCVILDFLLAFPVMWLWNWLMPDILGLCTITVWQAWGLGILCDILIKLKIE